MATETTRRNLVNPALDIRGSTTPLNNLTLSEEALQFGTPKAGQSGAAATITAKVGNIVTVDDLTGMEADSVGRFLTLSGANNAGNNGTFLITEYVDATSVKVYNADGVSPDNDGDIVWAERLSYMLEDDLNYTRTDRKAIKGTGSHTSAIPTYTRPDATGTPRAANLTNLAGFTTDAKSWVRDVLEHNTYLRAPISGADGNLLTGDDTFTTDAFHFTDGDLNSFITISGGTAADGTYRIKAVTDGQTLELEGLGEKADADETCSWALVAGLKGVLSARGWADATDTTGIPIADSGAYDETKYDATYVEMIDPTSGHHPTTNAGLSIFGRSFGDAKNPNMEATSEGTRFFVALYTGLNDGTATPAALEMLSGKSGAAGALAGGNKIITGLTGMVASDVGHWITIYDCSAAGNCGIYEIETVNSATSVTVVRTGNFSADATVKWAVSQEGPLWDFYNGDRYRFDQLEETAGRTTMIGGIQSDAALALAIHNLQEFTGENPGQTSPTITNPGNYYVLSELPNPSDTDLEEIVNTINDQIGSRDYTGSIIHDGETITESLQYLSDAVEAVSVVRMIERLAVAVPKNTAHSLPAGTYTQDGTNNGANLWVYWRGLLRDPGTVANGDNYAETSTTQITPYERIEAFDHINYFVLK